MENSSYLCAENSKLLSATTMNIKEKIKEKGKTISELAETFGMTQPNLSMQLKNMENNMSISLLSRIAAELGISVSELIDDPLRTPNTITIDGVKYKKEKED